MATPVCASLSTDTVVVKSSEVRHLQTYTSCAKIVSTQEELKDLKKDIKQDYTAPKKYIKKLSKYKKSFFKKNALLFVTTVVDENGKDYTISSVQKKKKKFVVKIQPNWTLSRGQCSTCVVRYQEITYIIPVKKSDAKKRHKVEVKYLPIAY